MIEENKAIIREYFEAISGKPKPQSVVDKYISNRDLDLKNHIIAFEESVPHYLMIIEDIIAEGDKVAVRFTIKGIHRNELFGQPGKGAKIDIPSLVIYQVQNRKIVNHWFMPDTLTMMQQIGAIPKQHLEAG